MFEIQGGLMLIVSLVLFAAKAFALIDCVARRSSDFTVIETLPRQGWLIILVLSIAGHAMSWYPLSILNLLGTVASLVYLAQVRGSVSR